jgi:pre-mRNA processing factor 3 (PRP3)
MLTKKEQKKMRKQRRQAELQDKRDRIRMGLIPPDAPKGMDSFLFFFSGVLILI